MRTRLTVLWCAAALAAAIPLQVRAGSWADSQLGKARFGEVWNNLAFDPADLTGRVVLIKTWADG